MDALPQGYDDINFLVELNAGEPHWHIRRRKDVEYELDETRIVSDLMMYTRRFLEGSYDSVLFETMFPLPLNLTYITCEWQSV